MRTRKLGRQGLKVSAIGLGCAGMSAFYGPRDGAESLRVLRRSLDLASTSGTRAELDNTLDSFRTVGLRYPEDRMKFINKTE